jgi:hypothetical protein
MKSFLFLIVFFSAFSAVSMADSVQDSANGNLIAEPTLPDYVAATRTPGFSPITDVVDVNGNAAQ